MTPHLKVSALHRKVSHPKYSRRFAKYLSVVSQASPVSFKVPYLMRAVHGCMYLNKYLDIQIFTPPSPSPKEMKVASSFLLPLPRFRGGGGGASTILHRIPASVCAQCRHRRAFSSVAARYSGHNRWSKIRHEKGAADQKKTAQRSVFAKHLTLYSKRASLLGWRSPDTSHE